VIVIGTDRLLIDLGFAADRPNLPLMVI